jgi:hypothetical protein
MVESECTTEDCVTAFLTKYAGELPILHRRFSERLAATSDGFHYAYIVPIFSTWRVKQSFRSVHFQTLVVS